MSKAPLTPQNATTVIAGHLQRITHQHFFRTFEDWLALAVNAFLRDDEAYMKIMGRYGPRTAPMGEGRLRVGNRRPSEDDHPADHFARALGTWMHAMQLKPADYLGRVYEEQAVANQYQGQFFTPEPVVELMASMTMPDEFSDNALVSDPACGSGRMLVAGIRRNRLATFVGTDTDLTCVHMTALNCLVRNADTWVIHGNSLSLEAWGGYHVRRTPLGGELHRLGQADAGRLIRLPFAQPEAATALSPPAPAMQETTPEAREAFQEAAQQFTTDKRGQGDFGFERIGRAAHASFVPRFSLVRPGRPWQAQAARGGRDPRRRKCRCATLRVTSNPGSGHRMCALHKRRPSLARKEFDSRVAETVPAVIGVTGNAVMR